MTRAFRNAAFIAALAAGVALAPGCGSNNDCNVTPDVSAHPASCTLAPNTTVTVRANWCSCGSSISCDALPEKGGVIQLEPRVAACDADCPAQAVDCTFTAPAEGSYFIYFISGSGFESVPLTVTGGNTTCS
jgi:hypothetical protein